MRAMMTPGDCTFEVFAKCRAVTGVPDSLAPFSRRWVRRTWVQVEDSVLFAVFASLKSEGIDLCFLLVRIG